MIILFKKNPKKIVIYIYYYYYYYYYFLYTNKSSYFKVNIVVGNSFLLPVFTVCIINIVLKYINVTRLIII